jgi:CheY-like chemotaxis protein
VAHDFNNLLTVMLGQVVQLRALQPATGGQASSLLDTIDHAVEQASELTRSLLLYGRKQVERPERFAIDALVEEALPLLEALAGREVKVSMSLHSEVARVMLDRSRVRQALLNLVGNAADATRGHGSSVRVSTHVELLGEAVARGKGASAGGSFVVLTVADDGRGIDPRTLARIFDPFFTTKAEGRGTGLGLAITQTVASQAGGFVDVDSSIDAGTTFRVFFPSRGPGSGSLPAPPPVAPSPLAPVVRVLVVDDLKPIRELVAGVLRKQGYDAIAVADTRTATEVLGSTPIDLLITDLHLPDGSGEVLARSARTARPDLRVIVMSGSAGEGETFDGLLQKPFVVSKLLQVVKAVLDSAPE